MEHLSPHYRPDIDTDRRGSLVPRTVDMQLAMERIHGVMIIMRRGMLRIIAIGEDRSDEDENDLDEDADVAEPYRRKRGALPARMKIGSIYHSAM